MDTKKTFCIKCGSEILHNTKFCEQCGAPVYNETAVTSDTNVNNNRNNKKTLIIVISSLIAVLFIVVIVFLVLLFLKGKDHSDKGDVTASESELTDNSENTTEYMTDDVTQSKEHDNDETTETESVKETEITEEQTTEKVTEEETTTETLTEEAVDEITIKFHYYRYDGEYEGWNVWFWANNEEGQAYYFDYEFDDYGDIVTAVGPSGAVTKITLPAGTTEVGFIVRYNEWEAKDYIYDQYIDTSVLYAGTMEVFTESGMNGYSYRICDDYIPPKTE